MIVTQKGGGMLEDQSIKNIEELEKVSGKPTGIGMISRGECPMGAMFPTGCMFCPYGHMLECHYPQTCEQAECSHYKESLEEEF